MKTVNDVKAIRAAESLGITPRSNGRFRIFASDWASCEADVRQVCAMIGEDTYIDERTGQAFTMQSGDKFSALRAA